MTQKIDFGTIESLHMDSSERLHYVQNLPLHHQLMRMLHSQTHVIAQKTAPVIFNMQETWWSIRMAISTYSACNELMNTKGS